MNKEKIFILLLFLVGILLISPISAESIDDIVSLDDVSSVNDDVPLSEDVQTLDENAQGSLKSELQDDNLLKDDSQNEIKGSFKDLQQQIDDAEGELNLSYDFAYSESIDGDEFMEGIYVFDKSLVINGNGHNISGENSARIFYFDLYGAEVTLNNLTLIGGSCDYGGAVYVDGDSRVYINNVNFFANTAESGGALYSEGEVYINDSVFDNNYIALPVSNEFDGGAAICNYGDYLSICNSNITNNLKDVVDESNYLAGAVVTYSDTYVENSYFANNGGSLGGAISSWGLFNYGDNLLRIINTIFEGNVAKFGGAIYAKSFNLEIDNCTFEDNEANGFDDYLLGGGAIMVCPGDFNVDITDTLFSRNSAEHKGGAIVLNVIGEGTIDNCTFKSNSACEGGAVYIKSSDLITISNSRFEANNASNGSAILNDGELVLSNNTISTTNPEIYNGQGIIDSNLKIVIFGNQTISAEAGDVLTLNATFADDNGNLIYDPYFRFSVNDEEIDEIDCVDGLYLCNYTIESPGENVISTGYDFGEIEKWISIVNVPKMDLTNFTISSRERIVEGEILTVSICLNYTNNVTARTSLNLYVNDTEYEAPINGKTTLYNISGLTPGKYFIRGIFEDNSMFNDANSNVINITVLIDVGENITAPEMTESLEPVFSIDLPRDATGTFTVIIDNEIYSEGLTNGSASITAPELSEGNHNVTVSYSGDDWYAPYLKDYVLAVLVHVKDENLVVPEATINPSPVFSINMPSDATGTFTVIIDNELYSAQLVNGSASITSPKLSLGNHNVTVSYSGDYNYAHYLRNYNLTILIESKVDNIIVPKFTNKPEPVFSIDLPDDATGTFIVNVNGTEYSAQVVNGSASIKVPKLGDGEYNIILTYSGDGKYSSASKSSMMTVVNLKPFPEFSQNKDAEIVYSNSYSYKVLLTFHRKPAAGQTVDIIFNGISYKCVTDNNGYATLKVNTKIKAGKYKITAKYDNIEVLNTIKINHLIKASIKMMKSKSIRVVVTLSKVNGKFLKSKKVRIVFKGKKYVSKTNKKGVAKFKISKKVSSKLKKGKTYRCNVSYGGDKIVKKFKIKKGRLINL